MRVGIIASDNQQINDLVQTLPVERVAWVVGDVSTDVAVVYGDISIAMDMEKVDLVIDCTSSAEVDQVPTVSAEIAMSLMSVERRLPQIVQLPSDAALNDVMQRMESNIENLNKHMTDLTAYSQQLSEAGTELDAVSQDILSDIESTGRILDSINRIAKRSKIIGLNSAIEAARVGELGRGFTVVAEEIKNLSDDSSSSVQDIEKILQGIQARSNEFFQRTQTVQQVSNLQQQTNQQIISLLQMMKELGQHIYELSENETA